MTVEAIQEAVSAGDYRRAMELFDEYARSLRADEATVRELGGLVESVRLSIRQARAHAEARIQGLRDEANVAAAYGR